MCWDFHCLIYAQNRQTHENFAPVLLSLLLLDKQSTGYASAGAQKVHIDLKCLTPLESCDNRSIKASSKRLSPTGNYLSCNLTAQPTIRKLWKCCTGISSLLSITTNA